MKLLCALLPLGFILVATPLLHAQKVDSLGTEYRVTTINGHRFNLVNARLTASGVTGQLFDGRDRIERMVPHDSLRRVDIYKGTHLVPGMLIGTLGGVGLCLAAWADAWADPEVKGGPSTPVLTLVVSAVGGVALGAVIGVAWPRWGPVDIQAVASDDGRAGPSLSLTFHF